MSMLSKCFWCWVPVLFLVTSLQTSLWTVGSCWGNAYGTSRWPRSPSAPSSSTISSDTWRCPPSTLPRMHLPLLKLVLLSIYKLWVFVLSGWHLWFSSSDALYYYYVWWWIPFVWFSSRICWRDTNCSALSFWRSTMTEWVTALLLAFRHDVIWSVSHTAAGSSQNCLIAFNVKVDTIGSDFNFKGT